MNEVIQCVRIERIDSDGKRVKLPRQSLNVLIARTPWIMLPAQNSGQNLKNTATTKNPVQNEYPNERKEGK